MTYLTGGRRAGGHIMTIQKEAKTTAAKVERILKIARAAFFEAIDFLACIEALGRQATDLTFYDHWRLRGPGARAISYRRHCLGGC